MHAFNENERKVAENRRKIGEIMLNLWRKQIFFTKIGYFLAFIGQKNFL